MDTNNNNNNNDTAARTEAEVLKNDKCEHPECYYSTSESSSCSMINGLYDCQTIKRIFRQCPGKPSVEIFRSENKSDGSSTLEDRGNDMSHERMMNPFFGFGRRDGGNGNNSENNNNDSNEVVSEVMGDIFRNFFGHRRGHNRDDGDGDIFDDFQKMFGNQYRQQYRPQQEQYYEKKYNPPHRNNNNDTKASSSSSSSSSSAEQRFKEYSDKKTFEL